MNAPMPPSDFGAHGAKQTPTGCAGHKTCDGEATAERLAFAGPGTREGTTAGAFIPEQFREGAFTPDLSVRDYTGNPHDSGGPVKAQNTGNRAPMSGAKWQAPT